MTNNDVIDDLTNLVHPRLSLQAASLSVADEQQGREYEEIDEDTYQAVCEDVERERDVFERNLRAAQDAVAGDEFDPVLGEIAAARREQQQAEARLRLLLAYAREFTPRPYALTELAHASGMSASGVRTAYSGVEIGEITQRIQRPARDVVMLLRGDAGDDECAAIAGRRAHPASNCQNPPTRIGGAPGTDQLFRVCSPHAWLVSNPHPITDTTAN